MVTGLVIFAVCHHLLSCCNFTKIDGTRLVKNFACHCHVAVCLYMGCWIHSEYVGVGGLAMCVRDWNGLSFGPICSAPKSLGSHQAKPPKLADLLCGSRAKLHLRRCRISMWDDGFFFFLFLVFHLMSSKQLQGLLKGNGVVLLLQKIELWGKPWFNSGKDAAGAEHAGKATCGLVALETYFGFQFGGYWGSQEKHRQHCCVSLFAAVNFNGIPANRLALFQRWPIGLRFSHKENGSQVKPGSALTSSQNQLSTHLALLLKCFSSSAPACFAPFSCLRKGEFSESVLHAAWTWLNSWQLKMLVVISHLCLGHWSHCSSISCAGRGLGKCVHLCARVCVCPR